MRRFAILMLACAFLFGVFACEAFGGIFAKRKCDGDKCAVQKAPVQKAATQKPAKPGVDVPQKVQAQKPQKPEQKATQKAPVQKRQPLRKLLGK
jgi:hypothetical protein